MPFGPDGVEIRFADLGRIVLVTGENRDAKALDDAKSSNNGSGKSSTQEILVWGLYGRTVKRPKKIKADDVIHNLSGKNCRVVVECDGFKVERGRSPNYLKLWENGSEVTLGDMRATQKRVEDLIGLSYEAFVSVCVFTDDQSGCFLECDGPAKRDIVENLLSLSAYRQRHEAASDGLKKIKSSVVTLAREYDLLLGAKQGAENRVLSNTRKEAEWRKLKLDESHKLSAQAAARAGELAGTDFGAKAELYRKAQARIAELEALIADKEKRQESCRALVTEVRVKQVALRDKVSAATLKVQSLQREAAAASSYAAAALSRSEKYSGNVHGTACDKCLGVIDEANCKHAVEAALADYHEHSAQVVAKEAELMPLRDALAALETQAKKVALALAEGDKKIADAETELAKLRRELAACRSVREPEAGAAELLLKQQIAQLESQAAAKAVEAEGVTPFADILKNDREELERASAAADGKKAEIAESEAKIPYYEYWVKAYGDRGIRKWVVDGVVPELNNRIAYWLQFLIDNQVCLSFDNQLEETITRNPPDGDPYVYHAMSNGQRRRLNLAVNQAFSHVMSLSAGTLPGVVFLDEVSTNIDPAGVQGIYNMICELSAERQVFVTTHDPDLARMLAGADTLKLVHEKGVTKIAQAA